MPQLRPSVLILTLVGTALAYPRPAHSQLEITPNLGIYVPFGTLIDHMDPSGETSVQKRQVGSVIFGARAGLNLTERFGLEASLGWAPVLVAVEHPGSTVDLGASIVLASVRPLFHLMPRDSELTLHIAPGIGVVSRSGNAWENTSGTADAAFVLGVGGRGGIPHSPITIRFEIEDYITSANLDDPHTDGGEARIHHDVVLSLGLGIRLAQDDSLEEVQN